MTGLWRGTAPLLLASTSPTRRALLEAAGLPVETERPGIDERGVEAAAPGLDPGGLAGLLAREKALSVSRRRPGRVVLGADQVLELEGEILHTPGDRAAAGDQLARLAGRTHRLHSAAALARDGRVLEESRDAASLSMRPLAPDAIDRYLDLAGPEATAGVGAYQIERIGVHLFERVEGDHATILGLPLLPVLAALRAHDLLDL